MKKLNRTVALLCCALVLLAAAPAALASEPSPSASQSEPSFVWEFFQGLFDSLTEVLPSQDESPADAPGDETPTPPEEDEGGELEPGTEQFPFPDPHG